MNGPTQWTTLTDVRKALDRKWNRGLFLCEAIEPTGIFPLRLPLKIPTASDLSNRYAQAREWVKEYLDSNSRRLFQVEWQQVNNRELGKNELPVAICFESLSHLARHIGKSKDLEQFIGLTEQVLKCSPRLKTWVLKNPLALFDLAPALEKLLRAAQWIQGHPEPGICIRQLPLEDIDTKFVEMHKKTLSEWLDSILDPQNIHAEHTGTKAFEQRYGFLSKPVLVRFRILDKSCFVRGLSDLTVRANEFCKLDLAIENVFVTENDINGLAFPDVKKSILLFGRGYGFDSLENADWLKEKTIWYWGDIDTHGFAILSQFRKLFPGAKSFLMDRETLHAHKSRWVIESTPTDATLPNLNKEERSIYDDLRYNRLGINIRLEQEVINWQWSSVYVRDRARIS